MAVTMRCSNCEEKAVIYYPQSRRALCPKHLEEYLIRKIKRAIRRFKMLERDDGVMVAVSGGKDSLLLWKVLIKMDYDVVGLHINLGLGDYSNVSEEITRKFSEELGGKLKIVRVAEDYGIDIVHVSKRLRRPVCSVCGTVKRYILNRAAVESGRVLATGHNLDDEAATLMGNILSWNIEQLTRSSPSLPSTHPRLARRIKPLIYISERESATYCLSHGIGYVIPECPHSEGARLGVVKEALTRIEDRSPGTLLNFVDTYHRKQPLTSVRKEEGQVVTLRQCPSCGYLTSSADLCAFCRLRGVS